MSMLALLLAALVLGEASASALRRGGGLSSSSALLRVEPAAAVPEVRVGGFPGPKGQQAFELWARWVNANPQIAKHSVALLTEPYDEALYAKGTVSLMSGLDVVLPPYGSEQSDRVVLLVAGAKPVIVWGGASEFIFEHGGAVGEKVFGTLTPAGHYFDSGLEAVASKGATSVVLVQNDSPFSSAVCEGARRKANALGMESMGIFTYARQSTNNSLAMVASHVAAAVASHSADVVVNCGHEEDTLRMVKQLHAAGVCAKGMLATNSLVEQEQHRMSSRVQRMKKGIMMPSQWSALADNPVDPITGWTTQDFVAKYTHHARSAPTYHAASAFLAGLSITAAMQKLSSPSFVEADFLQAMRALDVQTVVGRVKFSAVAPVGANTLKPMLMEQLQEESLEVAAPCERKTRNPEYPRVSCGGPVLPANLTACSGSGWTAGLFGNVSLPLDTRATRRPTGAANMPQEDGLTVVELDSGVPRAVFVR